MSGEALVTILGMAIVTYVTRIGGYWLMGRVPLSPPVAAALETLPGALLVALLTPMIVGKGAIEMIAAALVVLAVWRTGNLVVAIVVGVVATAALRQWP